MLFKIVNILALISTIIR